MPLSSAWGLLWINSGGPSVTYLIREHSDLLQDGADRSTPLSSSGEGNDTVRAHVVTASHYGPANKKDPKVQVIQGSTDKIPKGQNSRIQSRLTRMRCIPVEHGEQAWCQRRSLLMTAVHCWPAGLHRPQPRAGAGPDRHLDRQEYQLTSHVLKLPSSASLPCNLKKIHHLVSYHFWQSGMQTVRKELT